MHIKKLIKINKTKYNIYNKMNYRPSNVTMISDLPDIDEIESFNHQPLLGNNNFNNEEKNRFGNLPPDVSNQYKKFIRNHNNKCDNQSGMNGNNYQLPENEIMMISNQNLNQNNTVSNRRDPNGSHIQPIVTENYVPPQPTCIQIADHIKDCPICSKFYNNDKTIYIIAICILAIICILLLKKVLDL
jgi:hypothetical protein